MSRAVSVIVVLVLVYRTPFLAGEEPPRRDQAIRGLVGQLAEKDPEKVCAAAKALGQRGSAPEAVPPLRELLRSRNARVKWSAAEALWRLEHRGAELAPIYAELLTAKEADVRAASAWRLGRLGSAARPAVPVLAASLRDEDLEVRVQVGQALANLGPFAEPALPALIRAHGDGSLDESKHPEALGRSVRTSPALPALLELADDSLPLLLASLREKAPRTSFRFDREPRVTDIRPRVALALPAFGGRVVTPLLAMLESRDEETRACAALALAELAELQGLPETAIDRLDKCLDDSDRSVRERAAVAMSWVRPANTRAVTVLAEEMEDRGSDTSALLASVVRMSPHNAAAVKVLAGRLKEEKEESASNLAGILADLKLPAKQMLETWTAALSHGEPGVRVVAIRALERMGPSARPAKSALLELLKVEKGSYGKGDILEALTAIDPDDPTLVPLLLRSMDDQGEGVRCGAIRCLETLGARMRDTYPRIEARLLNPKGRGEHNDLEEIEIRDLVSTVVRLGPNPTRVAATLLKALRHPDIRAVHCIKNSWFLRDRLEDELHALLPASAPLLREALKDMDPMVRQSAALVLVRAGRDIEAALPVLMKGLWDGTNTQQEHKRFQRQVVRQLMRRQASSAAAVAAELCKGWQAATPSVREILEPGLLVFQAEALPHLLEQLRQAKTTQARRDLAHLLARFEGQGKPVVPILREELRDSQPATQFQAAQALLLLGPGAAEAVPELIRLLGHRLPGLQAAAASTLGSIGRAARPAVPALERMLKEDKRSLRLAAAHALGRIHPEGSEALTVLRAVSEEVGELRFSDTVSLPNDWKQSDIRGDTIEEGIARFDERGVTLLAEILDKVDLDEWSRSNVSTQCGSRLRVQAALLLARMGPDAKAAVPALTRALKDRDPFIRDAAASALGRIGPAARSAAPEFISLLEQQNRALSGAGAWIAVPRTSSPARSSSQYEEQRPFDFRSAGRLELLFSKLTPDPYFLDRDPYRDIRPGHPHDPAHVLSRIDGEGRSALPILREIARDANHPNRLSAALALWRMGDGTENLLPALTAAVEAHAKIPLETSFPFSREMRECLTELGPELKPAVKALTEWLKRRQSFWDTDNRLAVLEALGRLGNDARTAADVIRPLLQGDRWDSQKRVAAALVLFHITGEKEPVFPVLCEVLQEREDHGSFYYTPDWTTTARVHAARALGVLMDRGDERARKLLRETARGDENLHVRVAALEAMARHKQEQEEALKGMTALLRHPEVKVRLSAASACARLGQRAKPTAGALRAATEDSQLEVRQAARQALKSLDQLPVQ